MRQRAAVTADVEAGRIAEIGIGFDAGELRALEQAVEVRGDLGAPFRA